MKPINTQQLKAMLEAGIVSDNSDSVIAKDTLTRSDSSVVEYELHCGWDCAKAYACDKHWGVFNMDLLDFIKEQNYSEEELKKVLQEIQIGDAHWDWLSKAKNHFTDEYIWFFLIADGLPQGACLIRHPKRSAFQPYDIFYIEYVATAPWNRKNPMKIRSFVGVGGILIKAALKYSISKLSLKPGFSLHALESAVPFYEKIGMLPKTEYDKPHLKYFEMLEISTAAYMIAP